MVKVKMVVCRTSQKRAISSVPYLCFMARAPVCVWGGGGEGASVMTQQGTPSQMVGFISRNPNPVTISP